MKKVIIGLLSVLFVLIFAGCGEKDEFDIAVRVPAGSTEEFTFSHEQISPKRKKIKLSCGEGLGDTSVVLKQVGEKQEYVKEPIYLTPGAPVEIEVETGVWFQVGISVQNHTDKEQVFYLNVDGVEVRIEDELEEAVLYEGKEYQTSKLCEKTIQWLELSEEERMLSSYLPPEFQEQENPFGISLKAETVTSAGMTLSCSQSGGTATDELCTGPWYIIEKWTKKDGWKEVDYATTDEIGWKEVAFMVPLNSTMEWAVDWEWLYGKLPSGTYRIGKEFIDAAQDQGIEKVVYYAEFEVAG